MALTYDHFPARMMKAKQYEQRFAKHVATFSRRRSELQLAMQVYAVRGIDAANTAIVELDAKLADMRVNMRDNHDHIVAMLSKFDSPRERDFQNFVQEHGGFKACIDQDDLLTTLIGKFPDASEYTDGASFRKPSSREEELKNARGTLIREFYEDLEDSLKQNQSRFEQLLKLQNKQMKQMSDQIKHIQKNQNINTDKIINHTTMLHNAALHLANFQDPVSLNTNPSYITDLTRTAGIANIGMKW